MSVGLPMLLPPLMRMPVMEMIVGICMARI